MTPPDEDEPGLPEPADEPDLAATYRRRRLAVLSVGGVVVLAGLLLIARLVQPDTAARSGPALDAWVPYWALDVAAAEFGTRGPEFREVSPFWYSAVAVDSIVVDPNAPAGAIEAFLADAARSRAKVVPSVVDAMAPGAMAAVLADPVTRSRHVEALSAFVETGDFDGLDLDYEQFAFADGRSTWATTRPNWVSFVTELSQRLHADGRILSVSIPPVYDSGRTEESGYWVYDYGSITPLVDRIRVMAYDYSTSSPGPIAPLDFVRSAIEGTLAASGDPDKLVLGVPLYGYNWPAATTGTCPVSATDTGRTSVTIRSVAELASRRGATPVADPTTGEWSFSYPLTLQDSTTSCTQQREVHYVGADGAIERIRLARAAGFGGVSLWAFGYEDDSFWQALDELTTEEA